MISKVSHFLGIFILSSSLASASQDEEVRIDRKSAIDEKILLKKEADRLLEENTEINKKLDEISVEYDQLANETNQLVRDNEDLYRELAQAALKLDRLKKQSSMK